MSEIINVKELRVGKGRTIQQGEEWHKTYYELVLNTEGFSAELVELHRETAEGYLNKLLKREEPLQKEPKKTINQLVWKHVDSRSDKGPYEQATDDGSETFKALRDKLTESGGFWKNEHYKYWFHREQPDVIDRRAVT